MRSTTSTLRLARPDVGPAKWIDSTAKVVDSESGMPPVSESSSDIRLCLLWLPCGMARCYGARKTQTMRRQCKLTRGGRYPDKACMR